MGVVSRAAACWREEHAASSCGGSCVLGLCATLSHTHLHTPALINHTCRHIPQTQDRILDAPDLVDDYYLNLLDWSCNNVVGVGCSAACRPVQAPSTHSAGQQQLAYLARMQGGPLLFPSSGNPGTLCFQVHGKTESYLHTLSTDRGCPWAHGVPVGLHGRQRGGAVHHALGGRLCVQVWCCCAHALHVLALQGTGGGLIA